MIKSTALLHFRFWLCLLSSLITLPLAAATKEITDEECDTYGKQLAGYFNGGKQNEVVRQLDTFALVDRITDGLGMEENEKTDFRGGFSSNLTASLTKSLRNFTSARYLRLQNADGEKRLLLRMVSEEGAVNFMAFIVARRASGSLKWIDVYTYLTGETIAASSRRAVLPLLAESKKNLLQKLTGAESSYVQNMPKITKGAQLIQQGKLAEAHAVLEKLPDELKTQKFVLALRLQAAQGTSDSDYLNVITSWETAHPGDPSLDLISIDGDFMRKDYAGGIKRLDRLSQRLGGDNYLIFLKGNMQMMAGDNAAARLTARAVIAAEPSLTSAWDTLLTISLNEKNFTETITLLDEVEAMYPGTKMKPVIDSNAAYADFRASPEYAKWAAGQEKTDTK